jgi:protein-S-isoprenylcysteine O-methyltransferase Ste14
VALLSWPVALVLASGFAAIYVPVIASEERFLRATFPGFRRLLPPRARADSAA